MLSQIIKLVKGGLKNLRKTTEDAVININDAVTSVLIRKVLAVNFLIHPSSTPLIRSFFPKTPLFPNIGRDWIELSLEVSESEVNLNGVAFLNDSIPDGMILVKDIKPQKISLAEMVPDNFTSYLSFPLNNIEQLENNFKGLSRRINLAVKNTNLSPLESLREMAWIVAGGETSLVLSPDSEFFKFFGKSTGTAIKKR